SGDLSEAPQAKLPEPQHLFYDSEDRFHCRFAPAIKLFSLRCLKSPAHGLQRRRIVRRRAGVAPPLVPAGVVFLATRRQVGYKFSVACPVNIILAIIPVIGCYSFGGSHLLREGLHRI